MIAWLCSVILWTMGWRPIPEADIAYHPKCMSVFPHTSNWDFLMAVLYIGSADDMAENVRILVKPQLFTPWTSWFLTKMGCIAVTRIGSGEGGVHMLATQLRGQSLQILASPKGQRIGAEWKRGWYYLSQSLELPVRAVGLDYMNKRIVLSRRFIDTNSHDYNAVKTMLVEDMATMVPLYPQAGERPMSLPNQTVLCKEIKIIWFCVLATMAMLLF